MRSMQASLVTLALAAFAGTAIVAGCSADGTSGAPLEGLGTDLSPTDPSEDDGGSNILPDDGEDSDTDGEQGGPSKDAGSKKDASSKDSGTDVETDAQASVDAGVDAGPTVQPGDPCTGAATFKRACGNCGTQTAYCIASGDAGGGTVGPFGDCDEPDNACTPGTVIEEPCGDCGTMKKTCSNKCQYPTTATCSGQPKDHCTPGATKWDQGQCGAGLYMSSSCQDTCQWSGWSASCTAPTASNKLVLVGTVGQIASTTLTLEKSSMKRPSGASTCPSSSATTLPYGAFVELSNPTAKAAEVTLFQSKSATGIEFDMVVWAYATTTLPMTDDDVKACTKLGDSCTALINGKAGTTASNLCGNTSNLRFASIEKVTIPAGGKILVGSGPYSSTATATSIGDGTFVLNVRTDSLQ